MCKQFWLIHHDCTMHEKCFYFLLNSSFSKKNGFLRKLKPIYRSTPQYYNNCSAPTFLILFKKLLAPTSFKKEGRNCILYERLQRRDNKVITILYDRFFIYRTLLFIFIFIYSHNIWRKSGVEISFFCLTGHFCCWRNHIAVHLLQLRVLLVQYVPCFVHLSLEAFPISAVRKCLICRKSTFSLVLFNFFFENTVMHCLLVPNTLKIQISLRLTLSQSQHIKRLLNVIAHKHSIKYNPFIYIIYIKSKIYTCS